MGIFDGDLDDAQMMAAQQHAGGGMNGQAQYQPVPTGQPVQPSPTETAMANQLYQMQQMILQQQQEIEALRRRRVDMAFDLIRDDDGRVVSIQATEGRGR